MVGMARRAVPARVVAGGTNVRVTLAFEGTAPLHAARTSQRDVPDQTHTPVPWASLPSRTGDWKVPRTRRQECPRYFVALRRLSPKQPRHGGRQALERVRKIGSTGDPPVPVGDPPTGRARRLLAKSTSSSAPGALPVPPGDSPGGTGQWPVLPRNEFPDTPQAPFWLDPLAAN
jgi:hypothetical protein